MVSTTYKIVKENPTLRFSDGFQPVEGPCIWAVPLPSKPQMAHARKYPASSEAYKFQTKICDHVNFDFNLDTCK